MKKLQIFVTDNRDNERLEITDNLYWFEENGVEDFGGEGHWGKKYSFEILVDGVLVWDNPPPEIKYCSCPELHYSPETDVCLVCNLPLPPIDKTHELPAWKPPE